MKKSILSIISLLALASCSQPTEEAQNTVIRGSLSGDAEYNGRFVQLYENGAERRVLLDSAVVQDGKFAFAPRPLDSLGMYVLSLEGAGSLSLVLDTTDIDADFEGKMVRGGALNRLSAQGNMQMKAYRDSIFGLYAELDEADPSLKERQQALIDEWNSYESRSLEDILREHPKNALGLRAMYSLLLRDDVSKERIAQLKGLASPAIVEHPAMQRIFRFYANEEQTSAGKKFADVKGVDAEGKEISLSQFAGNGHYTLVDFWASWCGPCRRSMPALKDLYKEFGGDGLRIVGLAVWDTMEQHKQAVADLALPWPQIFNESEATEVYGVRGIPHLMLIAPDGTIMARGLEAGEALRKLILDEKAKNGGKL